MPPRKSDRNDLDPERMYVERIKADLCRFLEYRGIEARVLDRRNRFGEIVIGVVLERTFPI